MLFAVSVACSMEDEAPPVERCVWFADDDGDGYGQSEVFHVGPCSDGAPEGFVETQSDCADANASITPGRSRAGASRRVMTRILSTLATATTRASTMFRCR
jgi:hypothetical protein